ncbi:MAG: dihydroorotate dehydrogenase electron transfer subunit [Melioribacteraceae bacterium]|nr:dihydroorotate dehydrogenase electron transfer subunit [Melioribacteraceae bacterium]
MKCHSPELAADMKPGQFCNIKVSESDYPLLRRPFSICDAEGNNIYFMFDVHGEGTRLLSRKKQGDLIDLIAPLGNGFGIDDDYDTAVLIAGGIGAAPFPYLTRILKGSKKIVTYIGGRSSELVLKYGLENFSTATDDGSEGFQGNVVQLFESKFEMLKSSDIKVFACGPNPMLRAVKNFCSERGINCEVSVECAMACGFGICQGCPIEKSEVDGSYLLVCKDGPVFNINDIVI